MSVLSRYKPKSKASAKCAGSRSGSKSPTLKERLAHALDTQNQLHEKIGRLREELNLTREKYKTLRKRTRKLEQIVSRCELV